MPRRFRCAPASAERLRNEPAITSPFLRLLAELHRDSLYPMMGKDAWVAGADRGEAPRAEACASGASPPAPPPATRILAALEWWSSARSLLFFLRFRTVARSQFSGNSSPAGCPVAPPVSRKEPPHDCSAGGASAPTGSSSGKPGAFAREQRRRFLSHG